MRSSSSDQTSARSPTRIAAPMPNSSRSPVRRSARCRSANPMCVAGAAAAGGGAVHDVVVDERAGVHELECGDGAEHSGVVLADVVVGAHRASPSRRTGGRRRLPPAARAHTSSTTADRAGSIPVSIRRCCARKVSSAPATASRSRSRSAAASSWPAAARSCSVPGVTGSVSPNEAGRDRCRGRAGASAPGRTVLWLMHLLPPPRRKRMQCAVPFLDVGPNRA